MSTGQSWTENETRSSADSHGFSNSVSEHLRTGTKIEYLRTGQPRYSTPLSSPCATHVLCEHALLLHFPPNLMANYRKIAIRVSYYKYVSLSASVVRSIDGLRSELRLLAAALARVHEQTGGVEAAVSSWLQL